MNGFYPIICTICRYKTILYCILQDRSQEIWAIRRNVVWGPGHFIEQQYQVGFPADEKLSSVN